MKSISVYVTIFVVSCSFNSTTTAANVHAMHVMHAMCPGTLRFNTNARRRQRGGGHRMYGPTERTLPYPFGHQLMNLLSTDFAGVVQQFPGLDTSVQKRLLVDWTADANFFNCIVRYFGKPHIFALVNDMTDMRKDEVTAALNNIPDQPPPFPIQNQFQPPPFPVQNHFHPPPFPVQNQFQPPPFPVQNQFLPPPFPFQNQFQPPPFPVQNQFEQPPPFLVQNQFQPPPFLVQNQFQPPPFPIQNQFEQLPTLPAEVETQQSYIAPEEQVLYAQTDTYVPLATVMRHITHAQHHTEAEGTAARRAGILLGAASFGLGTSHGVATDGAAAATAGTAHSQQHGQRIPGEAVGADPQLPGE